MMNTDGDAPDLEIHGARTLAALKGGDEDQLPFSRCIAELWHDITVQEGRFGLIVAQRGVGAISVEYALPRWGHGSCGD